MKQIIKEYKDDFPIIMGFTGLFLLEYTALNLGFFNVAMTINLVIILYLRYYFYRMAKYDLRGEEKARAWQVDGKSRNTLSWKSSLFTALLIIYGLLAIIPPAWFFVPLRIPTLVGEEVVWEVTLYDMRRTVFYIYVFGVISYSVEVMQWIRRRKEELNDRATEKEEEGELAELRRKEGEWETYHNSTVEELKNKHESFVNNLRAHLTATATEAKTKLREEYEQTIARTKEANEGLSMQLTEANTKYTELERSFNQALSDHNLSSSEIDQLKIQLQRYEAGQSNVDQLLAELKVSRELAKKFAKELEELEGLKEEVKKMEDLKRINALLQKNASSQVHQKNTEILGGMILTDSHGREYHFSKDGEVSVKDVATNGELEPSFSISVSEAMHSPQEPIGYYTNARSKNGQITGSNSGQGGGSNNGVSSPPNLDMEKSLILAEKMYLEGVSKKEIKEVLNCSESDFQDYKKKKNWDAKRFIIQKKENGLIDEKIWSKLKISKSKFYNLKQEINTALEFKH